MSWRHPWPQWYSAEKPPYAAPIELRKTDDYRTRACNIWFSLGFSNDRLGMIDRIAGYLEIYAGLDRGDVSKDTAA